MLFSFREICNGIISLPLEVVSLTVHQSRLCGIFNVRAQRLLSFFRYCETGRIFISLLTLRSLNISEALGINSEKNYSTKESESYNIFSQNS